MKRVKELLLTFALVTTGVLLAAAIFMTIFWQGEKVTGAILWQILSVAALCSLGNFIWPEREVSKKELELSILALSNSKWRNDK